MEEAKPDNNSAERTRAWQTWLDRFGPLAALVIVFLLLATFGPGSFRSSYNLETIARQTTIVGMGALGMTFIIVLGGIDLSVGSVVAFGTVVIAACLSATNLLSNPWLAAGLAIAVGALCGLANGMLITFLRVVPFIVTLGTMLLIRGVAKGLSHEQKIDAPETWLNGLLASPPVEQGWMLLPAGVWLLIVMAIFSAFLLHYTRLGRHAYAIGSNEQAARLGGVPVERVKIMVYTLGGALAGLAGLMQFSLLTAGDPATASGLELDVIAAVIIGGGSLAGGKGGIGGTIIGALLMSVIRTGCSQMGLQSWVQDILTGAIIITAVALDRLRHGK